MYEDSLILKYEQTLIQTNYLIKNNIQLYIFFVLLTHVIATEGMSVVFSNIFVKRVNSAVYFAWFCTSLSSYCSFVFNF
jgi:hypothetical protein